jgi:hypothetical protein
MSSGATVNSRASIVTSGGAPARHGTASRSLHLPSSAEAHVRLTVAGAKKGLVHLLALHTRQRPEQHACTRAMRVWKAVTTAICNTRRTSTGSRCVSLLYVKPSDTERSKWIASDGTRCQAPRRSSNPATQRHLSTTAAHYYTQSDGYRTSTGRAMRTNVDFTEPSACFTSTVAQDRHGTPRR